MSAAVMSKPDPVLWSAMSSAMLETARVNRTQAYLNECRRCGNVAGSLALASSVAAGRSRALDAMQVLHVIGGDRATESVSRAMSRMIREKGGVK